MSQLDRLYRGRKIAFVFLILSFFGSHFSQARFATPETSTIIDLKYFQTVKVRKDFTSFRTREVVYKIMSEGGLAAGSVVTLNFNPKYTKLKFISASIENDGETKRLTSDHYLYKDASSNNTLKTDSNRSLVINFPNTKIGSVLSYKVEYDDVPGTASNFYYFSFEPSRYQVDQLRVIFESEFPLYYSENNTTIDNKFKHIFLKTEEKKDGRYIYKVENTEPLRFDFFGETDLALISDRIPFFGFSSMQDWQDAYVSERKKYHEIGEQPLPPKLNAKMNEWIAAYNLDKEPRAPESQVKVIKELFQWLISSYRYYADSRRDSGEYIPRSLSAIEESGYADCKDYSILLLAALKKIGVKSQVVWVWRSESEVPPDYLYQRPVDSWINHAVLRAQVGGKEYWIDGTNRSNYIDSPLPDIAGRKGVVLEENRTYLIDIPRFSPEKNIYMQVTEYDFRKGHEAVRVNHKVETSGYQAYLTAINELMEPVNVRDELLIKGVVGNEKYTNAVVLVDDSQYQGSAKISYRVQAEAPVVLTPTSAGLSFQLPVSQRLQKLIFNIEDRESDLYFQSPVKTEYITKIINKRTVGEDFLNCRFSNKWFDFKRKFVTHRKGVDIFESMTTKTNLIPYRELRSEEFQRMQKQLRKCLSYSLILQNLP